MINFLKSTLKLDRLKENILLIIFWIALILSINTFPSNFLIQKDYLIKNLITIETSKGLMNIVEILRFCFTFFIVNLFLIFMLLKTKYKKNYVILFYILIFLFYLIGLGSLNLSNLFNIERIFLTIFAIAGLLIFQVSTNINNYKNLEKIYYIFLLSLMLILSIIFIIYYFIYFKAWFYTSESWYLYNSQIFSKMFFNDPNIRVTGLSRIALVLLIFLLAFKNFFKKKNIKYFYFLFFINIVFIWSIQSRTIIYALPIVIIFLTLIFESKSKFKSLKNYFLIALCSVIFFEMVIKNIKINYNKNNKILIYDSEIKKIKSEMEILENKLLTLTDESEKIPFLYRIKVLKNELDARERKTSSIDFKEKNLIEKDQNFSFDKTRLNPVLGTDNAIASSRLDIWKISLDNYNFKKIFGYGPQADRYEILTKENILKDKKYKGKDGYMTNASNAFLYTFLCGGYPALITLILFYIYILYLFYVYIKNKIYLKNDSLLNCAIGIIFFLFIRNLVENSNMIYSIDFILFLISTSIFELKVQSKKIK